MRYEFSSEQGKQLLGLARQTIGQRLGLSPEPDPHLLDDPEFQQSYATFVTLKDRDTLRGCIGNLEASGSLVESIRRNALSAAFDDSRFAPLTAGEFSRVRLEISILSPPQRLAYDDAGELVEKLRPGIDGVILQLGKARATFLPQVWEQLPEPADFLGHLCLKAGVSPSAWRQSEPDIFLYQVQHFEEKEGTCN